MVVGVLAFQGDFAEHIDVLTKMRVKTVLVRSLEDLSKVDALIIPGGESTVIGKFLQETGMGKEIVRRVKAGRQKGRTAEGSLFVYGTCAGAILLARKVKGKNVLRPLGLIDIVVDRNAYGSQADSFEAALKIVGTKEMISVSFIRAPKITHTGRRVTVLAEFGDNPVLIRQGNVLAGTFHPEMRFEPAIHRYFLTMAKQELL